MILVLPNQQKKYTHVLVLLLTWDLYSEQRIRKGKETCNRLWRRHRVGVDRLEKKLEIVDWLWEEERLWFSMLIDRRVSHNSKWQEKTQKLQSPSSSLDFEIIFKPSYPFPFSNSKPWPFLSISFFFIIKNCGDLGFHLNRNIQREREREKKKRERG